MFLEICNENRKGGEVILFITSQKLPKILESRINPKYLEKRQHNPKSTNWFLSKNQFVLLKDLSTERLLF